MNNSTSMSSVGTAVVECRSCGESTLRPFLDLGESPVANRLLALDSNPTDEQRFPLCVSFCETCTLVQLGYVLPATAIFDEEYPYYSSFSDALCAHAAEHCTNLLANRNLGSSSLVVELASNDGYLLRNFVAAGVPVLGIDPSPGPGEAAWAIGVDTIIDFFGVKLAQQLVTEGKRADVIVANNVMAHVPDLNDFVAGMALLLADDGVITVENPYVREMVDHVEYDTVYHEHFCYFSCSAVERLANRHGMYLNHVEFFPKLHGGTCRWYISKSATKTPTAEQYLAGERERGMQSFGFYESFGERVAQTNRELVALVTALKADGKTIAAYGAAAKGCTLLNSAGIGAESIDFVADRNVHKQGHLLPGVRLPIVDVIEIERRRPDYLLLLAWNFADEIIQQQDAFRQAGGKFIVPVPTPKVL